MGVGSRTGVHPLPLLPASEIKQPFLSYQHLSVENWLSSGEQPDLGSVTLRRLDSILWSSDGNYCPSSAEEAKKKTCTKEKLIWQLRRCIDIRAQMKYDEDYKSDKEEKVISKNIVSTDSIRFDDQ